MVVADYIGIFYISEYFWQMTVQPVIMRENKTFWNVWKKNGDEISFAKENYKRKKN